MRGLALLACSAHASMEETNKQRNRVFGIRSPLRKLNAEKPLSKSLPLSAVRGRGTDAARRWWMRCIHLKRLTYLSSNPKNHVP